MTSRKSAEERQKRYVRKRWELLARRMNKAGRERMPDPCVHWYVGFAASGKEFVAQKQLEEWGALTYLPLSRRWRKVNRYKKVKERFAYPALAGCVFIGIPEGHEDWFGLFELSAVGAVLSVGDAPAEVQGAELKRFIDDNWQYFSVPNEQRWMRTYKEFEEGDRVKIADGPFAGHLVDCGRIHDGIAHILLSILGQTQHLEFPLDQLESVG